MNLATAQSNVEYCYQLILAASRPRERLTVSRWADKNRWLSSKQGGEPGRWRTSRNPILGEIMDALSLYSPVREMVIMKSSQRGITEAVVNWLGYIIDHAPSPTMVFMPTLESRDTWKVQKLNPLFVETQCIREILGGLRSRDTANSKELIDFPGGILFLAGGNSPNSYAQKSVANLVMDDLDRFPEEIGKEGDPVALARGRLKAFPRSKLVLISTPTIKGASLIEREFEDSDQRRYHLPCPQCGEFQFLKWSHVQSDIAKRTAWYECEHCAHHIEEHYKPQMLDSAKWIATVPENPRRGYHVDDLAAPIGLGPTWLEMVREFAGIGDDLGKRQTFINTKLGETWRDETSSLKPHELAKRMEDTAMRTIPIGCLALSVGVDTQDQWLALTTLGWGANHLWIVDYSEIKGDTTNREVWDELEMYLHTPLKNSFGRAIRIRAAGVDSRGHRGEQVKQFVTRSSLRIPVFSVQGSTARLGRPIAVNPSFPDRNRKGKPLVGGYALWNVGTEYCKSFLLKRLVADEPHAPEDRVIRFPAGLDDDYFNGLLSEYYDPIKKRYLPKKGAHHKRNEPLDTLVYAWAIGDHKQIALGKYRNGRVDPHYWARLAQILEAPLPPEGAPAPVPAAPTGRRVINQGVGGGFVNRWRR
jgi:phage terminase large subunit GpA-like protein